MQFYKRGYLQVLILGTAFVLSGCGQKSGDPKQAHGFPTPEVGVVTIASKALPMIKEFPGRINAVREAQVRARVTGILLKRVFQEGSDVKEGDVLLQIDPASLQANYDNAHANQAKVQAMLTQAQTRLKRYKELVAIHAVSQQEFDDANAAVLQIQAEAQSAKAVLETASLNLGYATVTAPISGRIGAAKVTEGALVSQNEATPLALIQQLDPIYFDFTQSSTEVLRLKRLLDQGLLQSIAPGEAKVDLLLDEGTKYAHSGKLLFSGISVDSSTGMITVRAEFSNPDHVLLPGMFARVRLEEAINTQAITVLQRGVALGPNGTATAMIVTTENKVEPKVIKLGAAIKDEWIVTEGLKPGDRVIVEGLQKIRPGVEVKPVDFVQGK